MSSPESVSDPAAVSADAPVPAESPPVASSSASVAPESSSVPRRSRMRVADALMWCVSATVLSSVGYVGWRTALQGEPVAKVLPFMAVEVVSQEALVPTPPPVVAANPAPAVMVSPAPVAPVAPAPVVAEVSRVIAPPPPLVLKPSTFTRKKETGIDILAHGRLVAPPGAVPNPVDNPEIVTTEVKQENVTLFGRRIRRTN